MLRRVVHQHLSKVKLFNCGLDASIRNVNAVTISAAPRMVCVAQSAVEKGVLLLIEAARCLAERGNEFELVMVGDGPLRGELDRLISQRLLGSWVRISGWLSEDKVRTGILAARSLVLPSFGEGPHVAIMEVMALRRPVLTTYLVGIPELVQPGESGWLVPAGDIEELVAEMSDILSKPTGVLQCMGKAAYIRALARHNIDAEAAKLAALFKGVES